MPGKLGTATLFLQANAKGLNAGLGKAKKGIGKFASNAQGKFQGVANKIPGIGGALAGLATPAGLATAAVGLLAGVLTKSVSAFVSTGDAVQKMALRTGFSTESISEFRHALQISGSDIQGFENGIKRMSSFILDAKDGLSTSTDALDRLGVSVQNLEGLSPEQAFELLSNAVAEVPDELEKAALAQDVFGRAGTKLLPLLNEGADGIAALREEAHELGIVFDQEAADSAAKFADGMTRLKAKGSALLFTIGGKLVPVILKFGKYLNQEVLPPLKELWQQVSRC